MNHRILILSAMVLAVVFSSCKKLFEEEELSMKRTNYTNYNGKGLRINGYYYNRYQTYSNNRGVEYDRVEEMFLYRNGIAIASGNYEFSGFEQLEKKFKSREYNEMLKNWKSAWRVFQVHHDTIEFEGWKYRDDRPGLGTFKEIGIILNDTTFVITNVDGKELIYPEVTRFDVFHFKPFAPKPDSTNSFIK